MKWWWLALVAFVFVSPSEGDKAQATKIQCYVCNSYEHNDCVVEGYSNNTDHLQDCDIPECRKFVWYRK